MKPQHFIDDVRELIRRLFPSRNADDYAGHSFRRGGTTAMLQAGVSQVIVQRHAAGCQTPSSATWTHYLCLPPASSDAGAHPCTYQRSAPSPLTCSRARG